MRTLLCLFSLCLLPLVAAQVAPDYEVHAPAETSLVVDEWVPINVTISPLCPTPASVVPPQDLRIAVTVENPNIAVVGPDHVSMPAYVCAASPAPVTLQFNATANIKVPALQSIRGKFTFASASQVPLPSPAIDASFLVRVEPVFGLGGANPGTITGEVQIPAASLPSLLAGLCLAFLARRSP